MKIVSLILARGGSKGIPKKNLLKICGKPLIQYSIEASLGSISSETWVSTDCAEIAEVSRSLGANVIIRPEEISGDNSKSESALLHFADQELFDFLVFWSSERRMVNVDSSPEVEELAAIMLPPYMLSIPLIKTEESEVVLVTPYRNKQ